MNKWSKYLQQTQTKIVELDSLFNCNTPSPTGTIRSILVTSTFLTIVNFLDFIGGFRVWFLNWCRRKKCSGCIKELKKKKKWWCNRNLGQSWLGQKGNFAPTPTTMREVWTDMEGRKEKKQPKKKKKRTVRVFF